MKKALLVDFYGTLVQEDGPIPTEVILQVTKNGAEKDPHKILSAWYTAFAKGMNSANSGTFKNHYAVAFDAFSTVVAKVQAKIDVKSLCDRMIDHWSAPPIFPESKEFLEALTLPFYIVSNGDSHFLNAALAFHNITPNGIISSESVSAYKPDERIFRAAIIRAGEKPETLLHVGDSLQGDVRAAKSLGIDSIWLNRAGIDASVPETQVQTLLEVLPYL